MRLLLIEDDKMLGGSLQKLLQKSGYAVDWGRTCAFATDAMATTEYDLILLDLGLPDGEGSEVLKALRGDNKKKPVIVITARDVLESKIETLDLGADDYIVKPFVFEELEAHIRARLRRGEGRAAPKITVGVLELDPVGKGCVIDGKNIVLSAKEFAILLILAEHPQRYFTRRQLEDKIYDWSTEVDSNALEYHIHKIRKKCGKEIIVNRRGLGYRLGLAG